MNKIGVLITTSMGRIDFLINRSLNSVLQQNYEPSYIVIVDDNDNKTFLNNKSVIDSLSLKNLSYIQNTNTKNMSGTGAWNTGIIFLANKLGKEAYVAILDDDDFWSKDYLKKCVSIIKSKDYNAVFTFLKRTDCQKSSIFTKKDLTINNFLIGNPGIQGSNMFFKIKTLINIGGFDENLSSATDRDLMVRYLLNHKTNKLKIIKKTLVKHYTNHNTVTSNYYKKNDGLNNFYKKHIHLFSYNILIKSLKRAEKLFNYPNSDKIISIYKKSNEIITIAVSMHNNKSVIKRCLSSIINQLNTVRKVHIVIGNDNSTDNWKSEINDILEKYKTQITILNLNHSSVVKTRNSINQYIINNISNTIIIGRLDSDDEFADNNVLSKIETIIDNNNPDIILAGNYLRLNGKVIKRVNKSTKQLLDKEYLKSRLLKMYKGNSKAELPSCNIFFTPEVIIPYPNFSSGEDHALLVIYLLKSNLYKWFFAEDLLAVIYNLSGKTSKNNKKNNAYIDCRKKLYLKIRELC